MFLRSKRESEEAATMAEELGFGSCERWRGLSSTHGRCWVAIPGRARAGAAPD
jgi:hypothetical protein